MNKLLTLMMVLFTANVVNAAVETGNANGNIQVMEYYDYQCPHCRIMFRNIEESARNNKNVHVVSRVIPVMDGSSWFIARAALASRKQNGYQKFNSLLMQEENYISKEHTMELARKAGLNIKRLQHDMHDNAISTELNANLRASQAEGITMVPVVMISSKTGKREPVKIIGDKSVSYLEGLFKEL